MRLGAATDIGKMRKLNEDSYFVYRNENLLGGMVADGLGGQNAGEVASAMAAKIVKEHIINEFNPDMDYGIAPMVKGKTEATVLGGWTWNINANCKKPELAYDLLQYLNSEKGDSILAVEGKASARKDYDYVKSLEGKDKLKVFAEELSYTKARPAVINEKAIDELIINAILEVDYGQSSAEDALTSLAQKLNENIASNYQ